GGGGGGGRGRGGGGARIGVIGKKAGNLERDGAERRDRTSVGARADAARRVWKRASALLTGVHRTRAASSRPRLRPALARSAAATWAALNRPVRIGRRSRPRWQRYNACFL